jgi:uncharacterized protein DUF2784
VGEAEAVADVIYPNRSGPQVDRLLRQACDTFPVVFRIVADATVVLHLIFVLFVVFGGVLVACWRGLAWAHVPAAIWGAWVEFAGWPCPLTPLENWLRQQGGGLTYRTSFVEHYLLPIIYPPSLSREVQWILGALLLALNAAVYILLIRRRARL